MGDLELRTAELAQFVKESAEYKQYHEIIAKIKLDEALLNELNEYRKKSFFLSLNIDNVSTDLTELRKEFEPILNMEIIKDFLSAEQKLTKLARKLNHMLAAAFDLDIEFLNENKTE